MSQNIEQGLPIVKYNGLNTALAVDFSSAPTVSLPAATTIDGSAVAGIGNITSSSTSAVAFSVTNSGVYAGTGVITLTANSMTTGVGLLVTSSGVMTTTGSLVTLTGNSATTAAGLLRVNANGLTSGIAVVIASSATAITGAGRLLRVDHTGATGTSAVLSEFASAANDETVVLQVTASAALALGTVVKLSAAAVTTGKVLTASDADALTTGGIADFTSNSSSNGTRTLVNIHNDHASATGTTPLVVTQDAPTSTHFFKATTFNTTTLWIGDGTTSPNTALTGTAGDIAFNCDSNKAYYCTGTTSWTALA